MKYPIILFFRDDKYSHIDTFLEDNKTKLLCTIHTTNNKNDIPRLFDCNNHLLVTFGDKHCFSSINPLVSDRIRVRWIHFDNIDIDNFNRSVNYCYINNITLHHERVRPIFSLFTTCYNSYDKIIRAYKSIQSQTMIDWEWVILDDSPDDAHFVFLKNTLKDPKIRLYKRSENNGSIGNVKNEVVSLCRGKYVLEMDHDDEILPDVLLDATNVFKDDSVGFVYMDFINVYEDFRNFNYGNFFGLGYSGYYRQKYNNQWVYVCMTPNINNVTLSHIVSIPNHPRIWRKSTLLEMGNYNEMLPICDDYEVFLRTAVKTKIAKIPKLGYVQYMNNNNNNFSLIRNSEINRLVYPIRDQCFEAYHINEEMKKKDAYEENENKPIWKRQHYEHKYCNSIINLHTKQTCIIGVETLFRNYSEIKKLQHDILLLDNKVSSDTLCQMLDYLNLDIKCYAMDDCTDEELIQYFMLYKSGEYDIIPRDTFDIEPTILKEPIKEPKKITIITPCIRPENLAKMKDSIRFDYVNEWIIVYDKKHVENKHLFQDDKIKEYEFLGNGISGNSQRNYGLENITNTDTYVYFLDDDNIIHPDLYKLLDTLEDNKIYTFNQKRPTTVFPHTYLLLGNKIELCKIDTAMFLVDYNLCKNIRWAPDKYVADGIFIVECYSENRDKWIYVDELMAYYNYSD